MSVGAEAWQSLSAWAAHPVAVNHTYTGLPPSSRLTAATACNSFAASRMISVPDLLIDVHTRRFRWLWQCGFSPFPAAGFPLY